MTMEEHDNQVDLMATAFRKVLSEGAPDGEGERAILIKRIPIICNDVMQIKEDIAILRKQSDELKPYLEGVAGVNLLYRLVLGLGAIAVAWVAIKGLFHI